MGRRRAGEAEAEWRLRLEAWDASGLSLRAFALREQLCLHSLCRWKKRLRGATPAMGAFARVVVERVSTTPAGSFELLVREGMSLRIPADFDEGSLARLVSLLGRT
jgi:hypothetical protein